MKGITHNNGMERIAEKAGSRSCRALWLSISKLSFYLADQLPCIAAT
jgi:hypothetical protein